MPQIFLRGQKLFKLKPGLGAEEQRRHAGGAGFEEKAWDFVPRERLCADILGEKPPHRAALICDAGLGKSTNMEYLQRTLAEPRGRQLPLLLRLEDKADQNLLIEERKLGQPTDAVIHRLAQLIEDAGASGNHDGLVSSLRRHQEAGRITLLIDGLDHVADTEHMATLLMEMLGSHQWRKCPAWISGRPTAFQHCWTKAFADPRWDWQFYRVNELGEEEIRLYMTHEADGDWFDEFRAVKNLLAIPRLLHLVCKVIHNAVAGETTAAGKLAVVRGLNLRTPAEIYCRAFLHVGAAHDSNDQGLLAQGLKSAPLIGLDKSQGFAPNDENRLERVERTAAMLGAIAFQMLDMSPDKMNPTPQFDSVLLKPFKRPVAERMAAAGEGTLADFARDFKYLKDMNINTLDHMLFREANKERLSFNNRTTLAFFAAYWACRHARLTGTPTELEVTRPWVVDALFDKNLEFREFWQFAAEMPDDGLPMKIDGSANESRWLALFTPLYDGTIRDEQGPIRSTEFIYRSWPRMELSGAGRKIIKEKYRTNSIPQELLDGFIPLVKGVLPEDTGTFNMGEENAIRSVAFDRSFYMHKFCVTNLEYELFDPRHKGARWYPGSHRAVEKTGDQSADDYCPAVNVCWYDAICFAGWLGSYLDAQGERFEVKLPLESQWEYACRAGRETRFTFDGLRTREVCTPEYCNYDGNYPDEGQNKGEYRECTVPVDGVIPKAWSTAFSITPVRGRNVWGLYQMHGNVWEWCWDWYDSEAFHRVLRGGGWYSDGGGCRSADRYRREPGNRYHFYGFRLAAVPCTVGAK